MSSQTPRGDLALRICSNGRIMRLSRVPSVGCVLIQYPARGVCSQTELSPSWVHGWIPLSVKSSCWFFPVCFQTLQYSYSQHSIFSTQQVHVTFTLLPALMLSLQASCDLIFFFKLHLLESWDYIQIWAFITLFFVRSTFLAFVVVEKSLKRSPQGPKLEGKQKEPINDAFSKSHDFWDSLVIFEYLGLAMLSSFILRMKFTSPHLQGKNSTYGSPQHSEEGYTGFMLDRWVSP